MNSKLRFTVLVLVTCISAAILYWIDSRTQWRSLPDPDRYLHLTIARMLAESGRWALEVLPQVHGLGWDKFFSDKEPLFHSIAALLHRIDGEAGVLLLPWLSSTGVLLAMALRIRLAVAPLTTIRLPLLRDPWLLALGFASLGFFCNPNILYRFNLLRAHTLGVMFFLFLESALLLRSRALSFLACLLFALAYHAFYLPLLLLACHAAADWITEPTTLGKWLRKVLRGPVGWAVLGVISGIVLSPSFPGNLLMSWRVMQIALFEVGATNLTFGGELYPINTLSLLRAHGGFLVLSGLVAFGFGRSRLWKADELRPAIASIILWILMLKSPRASEYLLPLLISLTGALLMGQAPFLRGHREKLACILLLVSPLATPGSRAFYKEADSPKQQVSTALIQALNELPEQTPRVFNVDWDISPQLIYANPKITVVDVLDPSLLPAQDPALHELRTSIIEGRMPDVAGFLTMAYPADYIATQRPDLTTTFDADPTLIRVYPKMGASPDPYGINLFRIFKDARERFVTAFTGISGVDGLSSAGAVILQPGDPRFTSRPTKQGVGTEGGPTYLDGAPLFPEDLGKKSVTEDRAVQVRCLKASPTKAEMALRKGASILGIGGGNYLRIWLNGHRLYNSVAAPRGASLVHQLLRLPKPLSQHDRLEVIACSQIAAQVFGVSVSTWTEQQLKQLCNAKQPPDTQDPYGMLKDSLSWPRVGAQLPYCIGTMALEQ